MRITTSRRSRLEIYLDTLTEIESGTCLPTQIMYGVNMNWNTLKDTLEKLKAQGLIQEQQMEDSKRSKRMYTLTEKGGKVLKQINTMNELLEPEVMEVAV